MLGPVLLIIYINDLRDKLQYLCKIVEDDSKDGSKVYWSIQDEAEQEIILEDLFEICNWTDLWLLCISIPKFKAIQYGYVRYENVYQMRDQDNVVFDISSSEKKRKTWA